MRCPNCGECDSVNVWFDLGYRVTSAEEGSNASGFQAWEFHRALAQTMPVFCGGCGSEDIELSDDEWDAVLAGIDRSGAAASAQGEP